MSSIQEFLNYTLGVILKTASLVLGFCVSTGIGLALYQTLKTIARTPSQRSSDEKESPKAKASEPQDGEELWDGLLVFTMLFTLVAYGMCLIQWTPQCGVMEAALWTILTLVGIDIGVAVPAAAFIYLGRAIRRELETRR